MTYDKKLPLVDYFFIFPAMAFSRPPDWPEVLAQLPVWVAKLGENHAQFTSGLMVKYDNCGYVAGICCFFFLGKIVDDDHYLSKLNHQYICLEYIHHVGMVSHHHEILKQRKSQWPTQGFKKNVGWPYGNRGTSGKNDVVHRCPGQEFGWGI